jgi:SAM-dependent methyltransferase
VFVSSAWHWLDPEPALVEISRVLRDGGRLGVMWTSRDREVEWVRDLDRGPSADVWSSGAEREHRQRRAAGLAETTLFDTIAIQAFGYSRRMEVVDVIEMVATYSAVITAPDIERAELLESVTEKLADRFPGESQIDVPMRTWCWRGSRISR